MPYVNNNKRSSTGAVPKTQSNTNAANQEASIMDNPSSINADGNKSATADPSEMLNEPRPQSVLSIHSSLSNPDCTQFAKEHTTNGHDVTSDASLPLDPDSEFEETMNDSSIRSDDATAQEIISEELLLQTKLKDLRTKKEEMLNLVKELQSMNKDSDQLRKSPESRNVTVQYERVVPIELVHKNGGRQTNSSSTSPSSTTRTLTPVLTNKPHFIADPPLSAAPPRQKEVISRMNDDVLNSKLFEINALKEKLNRLQDMMKTVTNIEKHNGDPKPSTVSEALRRQQYQAIAQAVENNQAALNGNDSASCAEDSEVDASADDEELENRVKSMHALTQDLRFQSQTLAAERDRLKDIKNELSRQNELKDNVLADLEEHVDRQIRQSRIGERSRSLAPCVDIEGPPEPTHDRVCVNDIGGDARQSLGKNWSEMGAQSAKRQTNNTDLHRETLNKLNFPPLSVSDKFATIDSNCGDAYSAASGDGYMPQPMRNMGSLDSHWRKHSQDSTRFASLNPTTASQDGQNADANSFRQHSYSQCPASPQCCHHGNGTSNAPTCFNTSDPMLLQQFIQTQQMLINSVSQCNQLLWEQQRDINNLNSAVILLQERILNFANARAEVPTVRAESVPLHTSYNNNQSYSSRAQSEHPSSYQTQSAFTNYAQSPSHSHQQPQQSQSAFYRQYPTTYPLPNNRQFQPNNAFQANSTNNSRCSTQFPLPPTREFRREESQQHNTFHHQQLQQHQQQQHNACPATPIAYINNNPNSPLPNAQVSQGQNTHSAHSHPMFAYHNNNNHSIANLINGSGGAAAPVSNQLNHHSNQSSMAANINTLPPLSNLISIPVPAVSPPTGLNNINNSHNSTANNCNALNNNSHSQANNNSAGNVYNSQQTTLNNQVPPGNRANNYWDNFRSYSRQNLLSNNICKSNENVCVQQQQHQQQQHLVNQAVVAQSTPSSSTLHHVHHNILPVMDNKYFMHFRNQIRQARDDQTVNANRTNDYDSPNVYNASPIAVNFSSEPVFDGQVQDQQAIDLGQAAAIGNDVNYVSNEHNKHNLSRAGLRSNRCADSDSRSGIEASGFSRDRNVSNSKPSDKPFESLKEDVFMEVSTLIAANESRPQFLINLFRELQLISATDPLRDSLMDAFHELYNRYYFPNNCLGDEQRTVPSAPVVAANNWPENEMPQSQGPSNSLGKNNGFSSTGRTQTFSNEFVSVDKLLLRSIMIEVATFLLDLDRITEPAIQRIASIVMRQINNGSIYSISHDQLVRRIRNLNTDDQDLFLEELKRLLVNMLSIEASTPQQPSSVEPSVAGDEAVVPPYNPHSTDQSHHCAHASAIDDGGSGAEISADEQTKSDENEDLAEADQRCGLTEDGARAVSDCNGDTANRPRLNPDIETDPRITEPPTSTSNTN